MASPARLSATLGLCGQARKKPPTTALSRGGRPRGLALSAGEEGSQARAASSAGCASKPRPASPSFVGQCTVRVGQHHHGSREIFHLPFSSLLVHFTKSNAPRSEVITSKKGMRLQQPAFSPQVQAGSIPVLELNTHPPPYQTPGHVLLLSSWDFPHSI